MKKIFVAFLLLPFISFGQANPQGRYIVTSGSTYTMPNDCSQVTVNPASKLTIHTMTMPALPSDRQQIQIFFGKDIVAGDTVINTFSLMPNTGQVMGAFVSSPVIISGDYLIYVYDAAMATWRKHSGVQQATLNSFLKKTDAASMYSAINGIPSSITNNVSRSLSNAAGSTNRYTVSASKPSLVIYSVTLNFNITALLGSSGTVYLEYSTDAGTTWVTVSQATVAFNLGLALAGSSDVSVAGAIPANALVRLRPATTNATATYVRGQESLF